MTFRVRQLSPPNLTTGDPGGDMTFGRGGLNFLVDSPAAVAQCVATRLKLWEGEWFLDTTEGTPYLQSILGQHNLGLATALVRERVLGTPFVTGIADFSMAWNSTTRAFQVTGKVSTAFGVPFDLNLPLASGGTFQLDVTPIGHGPLG